MSFKDELNKISGSATSAESDEERKIDNEIIGWHIDNIKAKLKHYASIGSYERIAGKRKLVMYEIGFLGVPHKNYYKNSSIDGHFSINVKNTSGTVRVGFFREVYRRSFLVRIDFEGNSTIARYVKMKEYLKRDGIRMSYVVYDRSAKNLFETTLPWTYSGDGDGHSVNTRRYSVAIKYEIEY